MRWRPPILLVAIARAAVWAVLLPNAYVTLLLARMGHAPPLRFVVEIALALGALVIARPLSSTERARTEFAPVALRPWFLASAIGAMASGITLGMLAQSFAHFSMLARDAAGLAALAIPLFVAGIGVLRMRAWGILLGAFAAIASIPIIAWMRDPLLAVPVLLATTPAALMAVLVVIARARPVGGATIPTFAPLATSNAHEGTRADRTRCMPNADRADDGILELELEPDHDHEHERAALHRG